MTSRPRSGFETCGRSLIGVDVDDSQKRRSLRPDGRSAGGRTEHDIYIFVLVVPWVGSTGTWIVADVAPAANESVPEVAT